jgi:hypothetical protein
MAANSRRQVVVLGALGVLLVGVLYYDLAPGEAPAPIRARRPVTAARSAQGASVAVDPVRLDVLERTRPEPGEGDRDPFTFEARRPPATASSATAQSEVARVPNPVATPPGPPPVPPITLRFIGILNAASTSKIAVLSDGKNVFYGREGETIDGRYRIDHIGVESIEMAWSDGRGRQVIRLSGS